MNTDLGRRRSDRPPLCSAGNWLVVAGLPLLALLLALLMPLCRQAGAANRQVQADEGNEPEHRTRLSGRAVPEKPRVPSTQPQRVPIQPQKQTARLVQQKRLSGKKRAEQGVALTPEAYYAANARSISRFDNKWSFLEEKEIRIEGVNHLGAIDHHEGFIWAGFLNGPEGGKYDPARNRAIVAKIRAFDLQVVRTWDLTADVKWIDPVCFDGASLWVGDLSDLGIHRYRMAGDELKRDGVLRHPAEMGFSQGIRVKGNRLYSIHTFGSMDGLFEFEIPETLSDEVVYPVRVWDVQGTRSHLEGFDFVPGAPDRIWHAQGDQVDEYILERVAAMTSPASQPSPVSRPRPD